MKKWFNGFTVGVLVTVLLFSSLSAYANGGIKSVLELMLNNVNITVDGKKVANKGEAYTLNNGATVPFSMIYNGTTYLPVRKISELLGKEIGWDGKTGTVVIGAQPSNDTTVDETSILGIMNKLAANGKTTGDIYVTGDITVSKTGEVVPGIYDVSSAGGNGIMRVRTKGDILRYGHSMALYSKDAQYRSVPLSTRSILFEGDVLEFDDLAKVKFTAVPPKVEPSNSLGTGLFVVGRDILPGKYKLSTNLQFDPKYSIVGWDIDIYNYEGKYENRRSQEFNYESSDVAIELKNNEIIKLSFYSSSTTPDPDSIRLTFNKF